LRDNNAFDFTAFSTAGVDTFLLKINMNVIALKEIQPFSTL
jgi:hypothetical protein